MTTTQAAVNPFHGLAEEASAILRDLLVAEGLANEAFSVLPPFERAVHAAVAVVESDISDISDISDTSGVATLEFALAYLTGRIAKEQVIALQTARNQARAALARAELHWRAAIEAERRRVARESSAASPRPEAPQPARPS
jgi:hypothetical protein